jgi:flagellar biosynthesis component FlhA
VNKKIAQSWKTVMDQGKDKVVMLCDSRLRAPLANMLNRTIPLLPVIAYDEIIFGTEVEILDTVTVSQAEFNLQNQPALVGTVKG